LEILDHKYAIAVSFFSVYFEISSTVYADLGTFICLFIYCFFCYVP